MKNALLYIAIFLAGCLAGYVFLPTKTITQTVHSQEDKETIAKLEERLRQKTQTHSVSVSANGVTTTTTDTVTDTNIDTKTDTTVNDKITTDSKTVTEINRKRFTVDAGYTTSREYYLHSTAAVFGSFVLGVHTQSDLRDKFSAGVGIGFSF